MRVLVACEFSGRVREAFNERGHYAWSADLKPSEVPGRHYEGDVREIIKWGRDIMIAHPPCQYLTGSGARWWNEPGRKEAREQALDLVWDLLNAPIPRIALENPPGAISTSIRPADQYIEPWQFGVPYGKKTGLWLKGLPPLAPTRIVQRVASYAHTETREPADRARTFLALAVAMADQWGK